jgi:hypothetical protein
MLPAKSQAARTGSIAGQTGNRLNSEVKYSGRKKRACSASSMPPTRNSSQSGEAR